MTAGTFANSDLVDLDFWHAIADRFQQVESEINLNDFTRIAVALQQQDLLDEESYYKLTKRALIRQSMHPVNNLN